jgi:hypothetical protein
MGEESCCGVDKEARGRLTGRSTQGAGRGDAEAFISEETPTTSRFEKRAAAEQRQEELDLEANEKASLLAEEREKAAATQEYRVQAVKGKRIREGVTEYYIKWFNYGEKDNSWEPVANLKGSAMLIAAFESKFKSKTTAPVAVGVTVDQYTQSGRQRSKKRKAGTK